MLIYFVVVWFGVQFIRQGIYKGGVFRFNITLPSNFPLGDCPVRILNCIELHLIIYFAFIFIPILPNILQKVVFKTQVFHPLINPESGELCTSWGFPEWKRNNRICQLLQYIIKIFVNLDTKMTPVHQEASIL